MAGRNTSRNNWSAGSPATRYEVSGKSREFYTFENAPGAGAYATGGTIIDEGDGYIYHIFTGSGTFTVDRPPAAIDSVDYLIVAGGGGSAPSGSGGGGGGGFLFGSTGVSNAPGFYPVTVGGGGSAAPAATPAPTRSGGPSTAFGLTATGGGGAGSPTSGLNGAAGGSGGGGGSTTGSGGVGNSPPTVPRQGYSGGPSGPGAGGGGGGAGGPGLSGPGTPPGIGGIGGPGRIAPEFPSAIVSKAIPAPTRPLWSPLVGPGGYASGGGGGPTIQLPRSAPTNSGYGADNTLSGGSGIVCIRYKKTVPYSRATGGTIEPSTHPEHPGVWRHIFTSPGTFTVTDPSLQWIDYLAVGGGGGGGAFGPGNGGGGGGAGGFVTSVQTSTTTPTSIPQAYPWNPGSSVQVGKQMPVSAGSYPIGIGTGGSKGSGSQGSDGGNTTIGSPGASQIIAYGGGGGGGGSSVSPGRAGASGGGGTVSPIGPAASPGGTATPPPFIQGNPGGTSPYPGPGGAAGGGGGAGSNGFSSTPTGSPNAGAGGVGWYSVLSPSSYGTPGPVTGYRYFSGGGGGGGAPITPGAVGGSGGGGTGVSPAQPGTTNTGGGGGGQPSGSPFPSGDGAPGIIIIQYPE